MLRPGRPLRRRLRAALDDERGAPLTYASLDGMRRRRWAGVLGLGQPAFERGVDGLRQWRAHVGAGLLVEPAEAPLAVDEEVAIGIPLGPIHAVAVCRIVDVVDQPGRFGFTYGTLPTHPECGEESFIVHAGDEDNVFFTVESWSKPGHQLVRLSGPIGPMIQHRAGWAYVRALMEWVNPTRSGLRRWG